MSRVARSDESNRGDRSLDHEGRRAVVEVENVSKRFAQDESLLTRLFDTPQYVHAVSEVSLSVYEGETLGLVGESGSGKSTLAHLVTGLHAKTSGEIRLNGEPVGAVASRRREQLTDVGVVFQNAKSSIDPRMTVRDAIEEPLKTAGWDKKRRTERVSELLNLVDLSERYADRYAHELSGGQAQRVAIARAVATNPQLLVLDEPVSALDVSVKGTIINLLMQLQEELDLTYLFISHDLSAVKHIADRIAVMYLGELMEVSPATQLFDRPSHPYTDVLLSAIPTIDPGQSLNQEMIPEGDIPSQTNPPDGCVFHTRCPVVEEECRTVEPDIEQVGDAQSKCHFATRFASDE